MRTHTRLRLKWVIAAGFATFVALSPAGCSDGDQAAKSAPTTSKASVSDPQFSSGSAAKSVLPKKLDICDVAGLDKRLKSLSPESALATLNELSARADEVIALVPDDLKDQAKLSIELIRNAISPTADTAKPDPEKNLASIADLTKWAEEQCP